MFPFVDAGINAFVCGDIYAGVETRIGQFLEQYRRRYGDERAGQIKVLTTHVPAFLDQEGLRSWNAERSVEVVERSLRRLGRERLDLVQMHWWNYDIPGYVEMALALKDLQRQRKNRQDWGHKLRCRTDARDGVRRGRHRLAHRSVRAARPPPRKRHGSVLC